jgi:DNA adenine methylase
MNPTKWVVEKNSDTNKKKRFFLKQNSAIKRCRFDKKTIKLNSLTIMKNCVSYYGGKLSMLCHILPLIPEHKKYVEPFAGGAAVFFAKEPVKTEVLNDTNRMVINFYEQAIQNPEKLKKQINDTMHSRSLHHDCWVIYNHPHLFSKLELAKAFFVLSNQSFNKAIGPCWDFSTKVGSKKALLNQEFTKRLENTQIECRDANLVIKDRDSLDTFFYIDPPYYNSNCGHYGGYSIEDFEKLLINLTKIKGKFILSSYQSDILDKYVKENGWSLKSYDMLLCTSRQGKRKTEILVANYLLPDN